MFLLEIKYVNYIVIQTVFVSIFKIIMADKNSIEVCMVIVVQTIIVMEMQLQVMAVARIIHLEILNCSY